MENTKEPLIRWFGYGHLQVEPLRDVSKKFHDLAHELQAILPPGTERTECFRKLLEAKDAGVRAWLEGNIK